MAGRMVPVFTPPTPEQRWALAVAASYLSRAGTEAATRLLPDRRAVDVQSALLADMGDSMTSAATLCETLTEVFDGWPGSLGVGDPVASIDRYHGQTLAGSPKRPVHRDANLREEYGNRPIG